MGEGQKRLARRRGNNETSARASSEALEVASLRVLGVQLCIEHNAIHGALADGAHVFRDAPAREAVRAGDVRAARDSSRHLDRAEADRTLMHTCVEIKFHSGAPRRQREIDPARRRPRDRIGSMA